MIISIIVILSSVVTMHYPAGAQTGSSDSPAQVNLERQLHEASRALDRAWDAFHESALGGVIASPELQTRMENDLQLGRNYLRRARQALHKQDTTTVKALVQEIHLISERTIAHSHEEKP